MQEDGQVRERDVEFRGWGEFVGWGGGRGRLSVSPIAVQLLSKCPRTREGDWEVRGDTSVKLYQANPD